MNGVCFDAQKMFNLLSLVHIIGSVTTRTNIHTLCLLNSDQDYKSLTTLHACDLVARQHDGFRRLKNKYLLVVDSPCSQT